LYLNETGIEEVTMTGTGKPWLIPCLLVSILLFAARVHAQPEEETVETIDEEEESTIIVEEGGEETEAEPEVEVEEVEPAPPPPPVEPGEPVVTVEVEEIPPPLPPSTPELLDDEGFTVVNAGWGHMKLGGVMHVQFRATDLNNEADMRDVEFTIARMRILLQGGFLKDRIGYFIQGDMTNMQGFLLHAYGSLKPIKGLEFMFGRMVPHFTYYMHQNVGKLMLIDYPLVTATFAPWWQVGLEIAYRHEYFEIYAGVFNGMRFDEATATDAAGNEHDVSSTELARGYMSATLDNLTDDNMGKDLLLRFIAKPPVKGLEFGGYILYGMPQYHWFDVAEDDVKDGMGSTVHFGIEARYLHEKFNVLAEYAMRRLYYPGGAVSPEGDAVDGDPLVAHGAYLHVGYRFIKMLEVMLRGDYLDRDMDSDLGQEIWGTLGLNYYLDDLHARLTLQYILKAKQRWEDPAAADLQVDNYFDHGLYLQLCLMIW